MNITLCFIKEAYFKENSAYMKMLDPNQANKQSKRTHLCIKIKNEKKIPESQYRKLEYDYYAIEKEFETYLNGYIKAAKKKDMKKNHYLRSLP